MAWITQVESLGMLHGLAYICLGLPSGSFLPTGLGSQALGASVLHQGTCPHTSPSTFPGAPPPASNPINFYYPLGSRWSLGGRERGGRLGDLRGQVARRELGGLVCHVDLSASQPNC